MPPRPRGLLAAILALLAAFVMAFGVSGSAAGADAPLTKVTPSQDRAAEASTFTTLWADNNANVRPSTSELATRHEYRMYFQVEGDQNHYLLTEDDGETVSADAQRLLGLTQADLDAIREGADGFWGEDPLLVSVERSGTNEYLATSTAHYPSSVTVATQASDAEGNPLWEQEGGNDKLDADGNRIAVWDAKTTTKKVTYSIGHPRAGEGEAAVEIEDGEFVYPDEQGDPTYKVAENAHFPGVNVPFEKECLQLADDVTINFKLNVGAESADYADINEWLADWADQECWTVTEGTEGRVVIQKSGSEGADSLTAFFGNRATLTRDASDPTRYTIDILSAMYSPDQKRLVQSLTHSEDVKTKDGYTDYYQVWYDNSSSPNHSGDTDAAFGGSTVTITHAGTTSFDATKYWQDDDPAARPATTYSLWRFSSRPGASSREAAQVQGADGNFLTVTMTAQENAALGSSVKLADSDDFVYTGTDEHVQYVTSYDEAKVDLGEKFREKYAADARFTLAKYDPDGYPYVYFVRETMDGGDYEQVFGVVDYDGQVMGDTSPNYWDPDRANVVVAREGERPSYSDGVFNGGATTNVRTAQTQVSGLKTWDAAAFQDQLADVVVTMKCQRILKKNAYQLDDGRWAAAGIPMIGQDGTWLGGNYEWQDIDMSGFLDLTGWTAENLMQRFSQTFPRYDEHGQEYVYRWAEMNVQREGDEFPMFIPTEETDGGIFALEMTDENGETEYVWFAGYYDEEVGGIVNRYANSTEQHVDKLWAQVDADGDVVRDENDDVVWTQDEKSYGDREVGPVKVTLVRDDEALGEFELDGRVDDEAQAITLPDGTPLVGGTVDWIGGTIDEVPSTVQETSPWHLDFANLPEYAPDGHKYSYLLFEGDLEGYYSTREYDPETRTTTFRNTPGPGESTEVHITKSWLDGGNSTARVPVRVGLFAARDIYFSDGSGYGPLAYHKDDLIATVTLDGANEWYAEVSVPVGGLNWRDGSDLYIRELSTEDDPDKTVISEGRYRVLTKGEVSELAAERDADEGYGVLLTSWNDPDESSCRMVTPSYAYDISYQVNDTKRSLEVVNRRVGLESVDITKTWRDAGTDVTTRPAAYFDLSNEERLVSFTYDASGQVYAHMAGMVDQPLYAGDASEPLVLGDGVSVSTDGLHLHVKVSGQATDEPFDQATYRVRLLPKYDVRGNVLHWSVTEKLEGTGDYTSAQTARAESFGPYWHHLDQLNVAFENRRAATKDVVFHMRWYDAYVNETLGQRPDVYLTLYARQLRYDADGLPVRDDSGELVYDAVPVEGYSHYEWNPAAEAGEDPLYSQYATIYGLPKYDANGGEIVYYATAATSVTDQAYRNLDYLPQWFTYGADANVEENAGWPGSRGWDEANGENWFKSASPAKLVADEATAGQEGMGDVGFMLREDGTFNFRIDNALTVEGEKIWMNVPYGFESTELPDLSVYLTRRVVGGSYDASGAWVAGEATPWRDLDVTPGAAKGDYVVRDYTTQGADVADGQTAVAWTSDFSQVAGSNQFKYAMSSYGRNTLGGTSGAATLPKYDRNGRLYEYRVYEIVDGLIQRADDGSDVPGGFDVADGTGGVSRIYTTRYGMANSFGIENVYGSELGHLTVKKIYDGRESGDTAFPDVTFTLWRYYVTADGTKSTPVLIDTKTLQGKDFAVDDATGTGTAALAFDDLPIYTPAGQYWVYFVTENGVDGYSAVVALGDQDADSDAFGYPDYRTDGSLAGPDLATVPSVAEGAPTFRNPTSTAVADDDTVDVTFRNTYYGHEDDLIKITGEKWWFDQGDAFNTRPDLGGVELKVVRTYQDGTPDASADTPEGVLTLQSSDPDAPNYLKWERKQGNDNAWVYTVSNLERWAPDGKTWKYAVSEALPDGGQYRVSSISRGGTVDAGDYDDWTGEPLPVARIDNYLAGRVGFTKVWSEDAADAWRQRPVAYFTLQARLRTPGSQDWTSWAELGDALKDAAGIELPADDRAGTGDWADAPLGGHYMLNNGTKHYTVERLAGDSTATTVTNGSDFYNDMPLTMFAADGTAYEVEYRVVESRLVYDKKGAKVVVDVPSPDEDGVYPEVGGAYTPSQTTVAGDRASTGNVKTLTTVTNTLSSVSVGVTKTWDDESDAWGTRPGTDGPGQTWQVTYLVQRTTTPDNDASWTWLTSYGAMIASPFKDASGALDASLQSRTVSGTGDAASAAFADLPARDAAGAAYSYRLVEVVRGAYDVVGGTEVARSADGGVRLVTVAPAAGRDGVLSSQAFTNKLQTVALAGTKSWQDWGSDLAASLDPEDSGIMLTLERTTNPDAESPAWEKVYKTVSGAPAMVQPAWERRQDGTWAFAYAGLPKADQAGRAYTYRAHEVAGSVAGYFPLVETGAATAPGDAADTQVNAGITNVATRFTFEKLGDKTTGSDAEALGGVKFEVRDAGGAVVATWERGSDGTVTSFVGATKMTGEAAGYIVGLAAGTYTVHEAAAPAGHVAAADFRIKIAATGEVTLADAEDASYVTLASAGGMGAEARTATLAVTDQVTRGAVALEKFHLRGTEYVAVAGVTFDLYAGTFDASAENGGGVCVARDLMTNEAGRWSSGAAGVSLCWENVEAAFGDLSKYFVTADDGLPAGDYYFLETGESADTVKPSTLAGAAFPFTIAQNGTAQPETVTVQAENAEFTAQVSLAKLDSETGAGVDGARFTLEYRPLGADVDAAPVTFAGLETGRAYTFGDDMAADGVTSASAGRGALSLAGLKKGAYALYETDDLGYDLGTGRVLVASFTLSDEDDAGSFDLADDDDRLALNAVLGEGVSWIATGLSNRPLHGRAELVKADADDADKTIDGAAFKLQVKTGAQDEPWVDVTADGEALTMLTGQSYTLAVAADGSVTGCAADADNQAAPGQLIVGNLPWGTYRFVEVAPADGYVANAGEAAASGEFTIERTTFAGVADQAGADGMTPVSAGTMTNAATGLALVKRAEADAGAAGAPLAGAEFTVEPAGASDRFADGSAAKALVTGEDGVAVPAGASDEERAANALHGQLVVGCSYRVTETKAPAGYAVASASGWASVVVTVGADGSLALQQQVAGWSVEAGAARLTVADKTTSLRLGKVDEGSSPLPGAVFVLTPAEDGDTFADGTNELTLALTDGTASTTLEGLLVAGHEYVVREVSAPAGYTRVQDELRFKVSDDGHAVQAAGDVPAGWQIGPDGLSVTAHDVPAQLLLEKHAASGELLTGATFEVAGLFRDAETGAAVREARSFTTGADGRVLVEGLVVPGTLADGTEADGLYTVRETVAPAGYKLDAAACQVRVAADGTVTLDPDGPAPAGYELVADGAGAPRLALTDEPISLGFEKIDARTADGSSDPVRLDGALFSLTGTFVGEDGALVEDTYENQTLADLAAKRFVQGETYTLVETRAPQGYALIEGSFAFQVGADGRLTQVSDNDAVANGSFAIAESGAAVVVADLPVRLALTKAGTDASGEMKTLAGATFTVTPAVGSVFADGSAEPKNFQTGEDGVAHIDALLVAGGVYHIAETVAPEGYVASAGTLDVAVAADGMVSVLAGALPEDWTLRANADGPASASIGVVDTMTSFALVKSADDGSAPSAMEGAQFTVRPAEGSRFADQTDDEARDGIVLTLDGDGRASLAGRLVVGCSYTVKETRAPAAWYKTIPGVLSFAVGRDGSLLLDGDVAGYSLDADGVTLRAVDEYVAEGDLVLAGSKTLSGRAWQDGDAFSFSVVNAVDPGDESEVVTRGTVGYGDGEASEPAHAFTFGAIHYTRVGLQDAVRAGLASYDEGSKTWTLHYLVREEDADLAGVSQAEPVAITVEVVDRGEGVLEPAAYVQADGELAAAGTAGAPLCFTNIYKAKPATAAPTALKRVAASAGNAFELAGGEFSFALDAVSAPAGAAPAAGQTARNDADGVVAFGTLTFDVPGTYVFTLRENALDPDDDTTLTPERRAAFTCDDTVYRISYTVADDSYRGELYVASVSVTSSTDEGAPALDSDQGLVFTNAYDPESASVEIAATKAVANTDATTRVPEAGEFSFRLVAGDNTAGVSTPMPEGSEEVDGQVVKVVANAAPDSETGMATVAFGAISYDRPGTYVYTLSEVPGDDATLSYSDATYRVTVAVRDAGGTLVAETAYSLNDEPVDGAAFVNTYTPDPASVHVAASKRLDGNRATPLAEGEFSFTLTPLGASLAADGSELPAADVPMPEGASTSEGASAPMLTVGNAADGTVDFGDITYTRAGTYRYEMREASPESGLTGGVTYDAAPRQVVVTVAEAPDGGHGLVASVAYDGAQAAPVFANVYEDVSSTVTGSVSVLKELSGRALNEGEFSFELRYTGEDRANVEGDLDQVRANGADGRVAFDEVTFLAPGSYGFELAELGPDGGFGTGGVSEGVTYDANVYRLAATVDRGPSGAYQVRWNVLDDAGVKVNAEKIVFSNAYVATTDASTQVVVQATKFLHGRQFDASQVVVPDEPANPDNPAGDGGAAGSGGATGGTDAGSADAPAGEGGPAAGTDDPQPSPDMPPADGGASDSDQPAQPPASGGEPAGDGSGSGASDEPVDSDSGASLPGDGVEQPVGDAAQADGLSDGVEPAQAAADESAPAPQAAEPDGFVEVLSSMASGLSDGVARFVAPASAYADEGAPDAPEAGQDAGNGALFAQDDSASPGDAQAVSGAAGEETSATAGSDGEAADAARLAELMDAARNEARASDRAMQAGEFSFFIYLTADPSCIVANAANDAAEAGQGAAVTFSPMNYTTAYIEGDPSSLPWLVEMGYAGKAVDENGLPVYTVAYTAVEDTSWLPASVTSNVPSFAFTVTVHDDLKGSLTAELAYPAGGMVFENSYDSAVLTVVGSKALTGGAPLSDGEFSFNLSAVDGGPLPASTTVCNDAAGTVNFGQALFDQTTTGLTEQGSRTFTYCVTENATQVPGVSADAQEKYFTVTVTRAEDGTFSLRCAPGAAALFSFVNVYTPTPTSSALTDQLGVTKALSGRAQNAGEFAFDLYELDDQGACGADPIASGTNAADGTVTLTPVTFTKSGVYRYELVERADGLPGVGYDRHVAHVTATVSDDFADAALTVKWELEEGSSLAFENSYEAAPASVSIEASKELVGAQLCGGQFSFELRDAQGVLVETVPCAADGTVRFSSLTFDEAGEYTYTVREVDDGQANVAYDAEPVRNLTVTVTDDGQGQLVASVSGDGLAFVNTYEEPAPAPDPTPTPDPEPTPEPTPDPTPEPEPTPTPDPAPDSTPTPEPGAPLSPAAPSAPSAPVPKTADGTVDVGVLAGVAVGGAVALAAASGLAVRYRKRNEC